MRLAPTPRPQGLSRGGVIMALYGGLGAVALAWGAIRGNVDIYRYHGGAPHPVGYLLASPLAGLAVGLAVVFLSRYATHRLEWARVLHREFHAVVHELNSKEIFLLACFSSVGEELFFRGALLPQFGLVVSSIVFAGLHVRPQLRFLPWTIMSLIVGLVMGLMYMRLGDLGGPIVAHFTINLLNLHFISKNELGA